MQIKQYYSPRVAGDASGETMIFKRGAGQLLDEIRQCILQANLTISDRPTVTTTGAGVTGVPGLAAGLNGGLAASLRSLGWDQLRAPGGGASAKVDWYKSLPSGITFGPQRIGIGMEAQFGNNYQFGADLQRLSEAIIDQSIIAGVCVVASDQLKRYKADRGAYFTSEKQKLDRLLALLIGSGAAILPGLVLIGIEQDAFGFEDRTDEGLFHLEVPIFDETLGIQTPPVRFETFGVPPDA